MFSWFERRLNPFPAEEPTQAPTGFFAFCWHYTKGATPFLAVTALLMAAIAVAEVWLFGFLGQIVDWLAAQDKETLLSDQFWPLLGMSALVLLGLPLLVWFHSLLTHQTLLGNFPMRIRWLGHRYLMKQSMSYYQDEFAGRVATKLMQTSLALRQCIMTFIEIVNYVVVYFLGMFVIIGSADWRMMLPLACWLILYALLLRFFVPKLGKVSAEQADARSNMTGRIVDSYTNIQTVKLFSHSQREAAFAHDGMDTFLGTVHKQMRLVTQLYGFLYFINCALLFSSAATAIVLWMDNAVTLGAVAVVIGLVLRLFGMSQMVMWQMSTLFESIGTVQDGIGSIAVPQRIVDEHDAPPLKVECGDIAFDHVRFHYGKGRGVMDDFNLHIKPGEKVGIVGRSGAGKSTLVNLLLRFYDVEGGEVRIDDQAIHKVQQDSLRANIGMVTQDTSLLHRSVRDNILYGRPGASEEELMNAVRRAHCEEFIADLSDSKGRTGLDAHVGERGVKLSGGQRQRIAIARVMLKDAPILILDEATSALDSEVENAIQENLYQLMQGKTVIAIAHRLSTIAAMDKLVVMDQGEIIEQGSHEQLLAQDGLYAKLWRHQSGGFLAKEA
ncbi:MAG TPA: multidrug ABC transporter ATP-binding protein [Idiomarina abyssalis]|mgnify:FL=1|jgi:ATP-binding cassette subfamily B multidrug efflux pump|uniref:ABC transporter ATP-binding protein n=2 Tax=Idiomarinaceae TaxID=267893 RepID=UPI000C39DA7C|nr:MULTISPECIES: ABC transporter ATP-binding protein [Idiomarina]MAB22662.1 multidrug ABC transporter ATP-binding protein [Idiomarina sp.]MBE91505.1 multidrug ABC transporter ATP-binding protein [Idiomarina sp.]MBH93427.1 multidrug ABC transporter ATP-binding protein [Idiomarina sp.]HAS15047.1 multidrug ABC transporter ATP-binding protein [Idiomarina abyssalis]|tara:strand:- start:21762 stop:23594 length:1833 start_codon:yes stop_codon:yes gene_type:complete